MQPLAQALPALAAATLLVAATVVIFAARVALLEQEPQAHPHLVRAWWRWLAGAQRASSQPRGAPDPRVVSLEAARRARAGSARRCRPRPS